LTFALVSVTTLETLELGLEIILGGRTLAVFAQEDSHLRRSVSANEVRVRFLNQVQILLFKALLLFFALFSPPLLPFSPTMSALSLVLVLVNDKAFSNL